MDAMERLLVFVGETNFGHLPGSSIERTKRAVLDILAVGLAGARSTCLPELTSMLCSWGGRAEATLLTNGRRLPAPYAALVNGTAARAWDLDDLHEQNTCHINASVIPAALAISEARGPVHGRDFITAVALGSEIVCRLSAAPRIGFTETGSIMSYQCAFYGAALTAARLMRLEPERMRHAVGLAHARVSGNQQSFLTGAMAVCLMQGVAAEGALVAAMMAERGMTGAVDVLEGRYGYYQLHHRGAYEPEDLTRDLGFRFLMDEVSIKPLYPCCRFAHGPIEATIRAVTEANVRYDAIERINVVVTSNEAYRLICEPAERKWDPLSVADAQFSLPFLVAWAAVHGRLDFAAFTAESLQLPSVRQLMRNVVVELKNEKQGNARGTFPMIGDVSVLERGGRCTKRKVAVVKGHPQNPMSYNDVASKFLDCARFSRPQWRDASQVVDLVSRLELLADVSDLVQLCAVRPDSQ